MHNLATIVLVDVAVWAMAFSNNELAVAELQRKIASGAVAEFKAEEFGQTVYSLAMAGKSDTREFTAVVKEVKRRVSQFDPQDIANTAWTFAMVVHWDVPLFAALATAAEQRVADFTAQDLAKIAWAFTAANFYSEQLFGPTFRHRCKSALWWTGPEGQHGLQQLHQWVLWHMELGLPAPLAPMLRNRCLAACRKASLPNDMHREMVAAISELGTHPQEMVQIKDGYIIDVVVQWEGREIGVLLDGPNHFVGGPSSRSANGATLLKRRQLRTMKWRLVVVPYWEWNEVKDGKAERKKYLMRALQLATSHSRVGSLHGDPAAASVERAATGPFAGDHFRGAFVSTSLAPVGIDGNFVSSSLSAASTPKKSGIERFSETEDGFVLTPPLSDADRESQLQWFNKAMMQLKTSANDLEEISQSWDTMPRNGSVEEEKARLSLIEKMMDLKATLNRSKVIDPEVPIAKIHHMCTDPNIKWHGQLTQLMLKTELKQIEWQLEQLERVREVASSGKIPFATIEQTEQIIKGLRVSYLGRAAMLQIFLLDFKGAHENIKRSLAINSTDSKATVLAPYCAQVIAAHNEEVLRSLEPNDMETQQMLAALRTNFQSCGYNVRNILRITNIGTMSVFIHVEVTGTAIEKILLESTHVSGAAITDLIRVFLLHRIIPLERLAFIIGNKCCELLLRLSVVTAVWGAGVSILNPINAIRALREGKAFGLSVFSNIQIWPVDEDLLVATDYSQSMSTETFEPVMHMSVDAVALLASAPRFPRVPRVLDMCSGSGVQGLIALRYYANEAVFAEKNPRALPFTRFNLLLNGMGHRGEVYIGDLYKALPAGIEAFDAIVANAPFTPNPRGIASGAGAMYADGGDKGDQVLKGILMGARPWLRKGTGRLVTTSIIYNIEDLPERLRAWYGNGAVDGIAPVVDAAHFEAVIFHGNKVPSEKYHGSWLNVTESNIQAIQYYAALKDLGIRTVAESVVMVRPLEPTATKTNIRFVTECKNLWSNMSYLEKVCQSALN